MWGIKLRDHKPLFFLVLVGLVLLGYVVYYSGEKAGVSEEVYSYGGETMGTGYVVKVRGVFSDDILHSFAEDTEEILGSIDEEMSTWREDSVLSRFNRDGGLSWFSVSARMVEMVETASYLTDVTSGAYDVTGGSLYGLWGWEGGGVKRKPSEEEIGDRLGEIGMDKFEFRKDPPSWRKRVEGLRVDLSSIAKGYAVDAVGLMLEGEGVSDYLVEIGGEVRVRGRKSLYEDWRVAVEVPTTGERRINTILRLRDVGMATSGDYRNFFEEGGRRYAHILDPRTGYPVKSRLASVTVIAKTTALADGLATALFAMGEKKARSLAWVMNWPVLLLMHGEEGRFDRWYSPAFESLDLHVTEVQEEEAQR
jgi:thiamine biosynthesis lipoprotein